MKKLPPTNTDEAIRDMGRADRARGVSIANPETWPFVPKSRAAEKWVEGWREMDFMSTDKPKMLDLFAGAGGACAGYQRAGFWVRGVDVARQPRYVGEQFIQADALEYLSGLIASGEIAEFDAIHASPPCQAFTMAQNAAKNADAHPDLVTPVRALLKKTGLPWVIENVVGAPLINPILLCGLALGVNVKRHRLFESNLFLFSSGCGNHNADYFVIFGHEVRNRRHGQAAGRKNKIAAGREAMGIDWMMRGELSEAIPPAYTAFIGAQLISAIQNARHIAEQEAA